MAQDPVRGSITVLDAIFSSLTLDDFIGLIKINYNAKSSVFHQYLSIRFPSVTKEMPC